MNWKEILKMAMPIKTREDRNIQFKQKIIDYEKTVIEPALIKYYSSNRALENKPFRIGINFDGESRFEESSTLGGVAGPAFIINKETLVMLGDNFEFILATIGDTYEAEGYTYKFIKPHVIEIKQK